MHILRNEVRQALTGLAQQKAPPEGEPLFELVRNALSDIKVDLARVKRVMAPGHFVAKWHRKGGILTEETPFTLIEPAFVASWELPRPGAVTVQD
jgi:hypothetical protein